MLATATGGSAGAAPHPTAKRAIHPAATAEIVSTALRKKIQAAGARRLARCAAHLENAQIDLTGPDPEAAMVQVDMLRQECERFLALWPH